MQQDQRVSIIIRSHNDALFLSRLLDAFKKQTYQNFEIVVCDDHSTDGTLQLLWNNLDVRLLKPPRGPYVPGKTLNYCVQKCSSDIVVFNNSDVIPLDENYLAELLRPILEGKAVGTFGNQHSRPDADVLVKKDHERAFGSGEISRHWKNFFSLASCAVRRDILLKVLFDEKIQYNEDVEWSLRCRNEGGEIKYVSTANCEHSHNYTTKELWVRFYNEGFADGRIYGKAPLFFVCVRQFMMEVFRDMIYLLRQGRMDCVFQSLTRRWIQKYGHWRGMRDFQKKKNKAEN
ncbi:MAG: glycosyltransferase [Lentisphaeria bacterium]